MIYNKYVNTLLYLLLNQWVERIEQYTDANIGMIKQNIFNIEGKEIVIASLQTLLSRDYKEELKQFDLIIFDEVHHLGAEVFSQVLGQVQTRYLLGLSATPEREDRLEKVFYWYLGNILYRNEDKDTNVAIVQTHDFISKDKKFVTEVNRYTKKINMSKMITNITEIDERNIMIINIIKETFIKDPERQMILLTNRRQHIEDLEKLLEEKKINITNGRYIGGMKKEDLKESESKQLIFATCSMAAEGLDIKTLDTIFLTTPMSSIKQAIGRIMRKENDQYVNIPLIIDIIDKLPIFMGMFQKRKKLYKANNYKINIPNDLEEELEEENIIQTADNVFLDED